MRATQPAMNFKVHRYPKDLILFSVRWYLRFGLSYRELEEILAERGLGPDHTSVYRWVRKFTPELVKKFNQRKMPVSRRWRLDETYIKVNGQWRFLYRAVDKWDQTLDFLLTRQRDRKAVLRFLTKATGQNGVQTLINIEKSGANTAGIRDFNKLQGKENDDGVEIRQCKIAADARYTSFQLPRPQGPAAPKSSTLCRLGISTRNQGSQTRGWPPPPSRTSYA